MLLKTLLEVYKKVTMTQLKPDKSKEVRHLASIIASGLLLVLIFSAVWLVKKLKKGHL
tara:strand:- start:780 stop:953 length:174 start_codon:yes stop_codon:yes gene_type:complete